MTISPDTPESPLYQLVRTLLFNLDAEHAHHATLHGMRLLHKLGLTGLLTDPPVTDPVTVMGITFPNRVGLAAGLDKDAACVDAFAALGFGHIEVGTVTPHPQPGNPKPRIFRLPQATALINRMGFNNAGVDTLIRNVRDSRFASEGGILGINIGKNADTPIDKAADDYLLCLQKVYPHASYVTANISSPNTQNLRELQKDEALDDLLSQLKTAQSALSQQYGRYVPLVLKIAPDLEPLQITAIADALRRHHMDGVITTNTTLSREGVEGLPHAEETGGLSGMPVFAPSTHVLSCLAEKLAGEVPIIGVGGILCGEDAREKRAAGASLVQLYTGLIYRGPELVHEVAAALKTGKTGC